MVVILHGRRDEQPIEGLARERAARDLRGRESYRAVEQAFGCEAADAAAAPVRNPETALRIDRHAVGIAPLAGEADEFRTVSNLAVGGHLEAIHDAESGIGVVQAAVAERRAVGHEIAGVVRRDVQVAIQAIQRAGRRADVAIHRARPDAPEVIGLRIVHAVVRQVRLGIGERPARERLQRERVKARLQPRDETRRVAALDHPADFRRHVPRAHARVGERQAVQFLSEDIDPVDGVVAGGPERPFAELAADVAGDAPGVRHDAISGCGAARRTSARCAGTSEHSRARRRCRPGS